MRIVITILFLIISVALSPLNVGAPSLKDEVRFLQRNQVLLRAGPSKKQKVKEALPFATAVQILGPIKNGYVEVLVMNTSVRGYVAEQFLQPQRPPNKKLSKQVETVNQCPCSNNPKKHRDHEGVPALLEHNKTADRNYCIQTRYDGRCSVIRPMDGKTKLLDFEAAAQNAGLQTRLLMWTLAFAPESVYRHLSSMELLNASPLLQVVKASPHPQLKMNEEVGMILDAASPQKDEGPAKDVWFYNTSLRKERVVFGTPLGIDGGFPKSKFRLTKDFRLQRKGALSAAYWNPCTSRFKRVELKDIQYDPSRGELSAALDGAAPFLKCSKGLARRPVDYGEEGSFEWSHADMSFGLVIDETKTKEVIARLTSSKFKSVNDLQRLKKKARANSEIYSVWPFRAETNTLSQKGEIVAELQTFAHSGTCDWANVMMKLRYQIKGQWFLFLVNEDDGTGC